MRPRSFEEFVGQEELVGKGSVLRRLIEEDHLCSMILWGPPGSGKTALARIIARLTNARFVPLSAVTSTLRDVRAVIEQAKHGVQQGQKTILFIDEIHRFNKAQQDAFLPHVEQGTIILIGATTENPSFSVISPLLSRCKVFVLKRLTDEQLQRILDNALRDQERGLGSWQIELEEGVLEFITRLSDGDARRALNMLEMSFLSLKPKEGKKVIFTRELIKEISQRQQLLYDKTGEEHYNLISAFHKSLRSSDPDAALYWMCRMLEGGEDPLYLARRMIRFASEDVGNADPQALVIAQAAKEAYHSLGSPEGELALAQAAVYLATCPKSNSVYSAYEGARGEIQRSGALPVPFSLRNPVTRLMGEQGYGKGYQYDHKFPEHLAPKECLPEGLERTQFYQPGEQGFEKRIKERMEHWKRIREEWKKREGKESQK